MHEQMKFCIAHHTMYLISAPIAIMLCNNVCDIIIAQLISANALICMYMPIHTDVEKVNLR